MKPSNKVMAGAITNGLAVASLWGLHSFTSVTMSASDALTIMTGLVFAVQWYVQDKKPENVL